MKRKFHYLPLFACVGALYLAGTYGLWLMSSGIAHDKTIKTLLEARTSFVNVSEQSLGGSLWYACRLAFDEVGATAAPRSLAFMQDLAMRHHMDEMSIVSSNGTVLASSRADWVGTRLEQHGNLREFLSFCRPDSRKEFGGQPFCRRADTRNLVKYYAMAYPDRSGLLLLCLKVDSLLQVMTTLDSVSCAGWSIGQYGYYEPLDVNGDDVPDINGQFGEVVPEGGVLRRDTAKDGSRFDTLVFPYADILYRAVVPEREHFDQRNKFILRAGLVAAVFCLIFLFLLIKITRGATRLDDLHRRMEAKTAEELASARAIQLSSLQRAELFRMEDLDSSVEAVTYPAKEVGGDLYSMFRLKNGKTALAVGDVSGKGVPAAMFMHIAKNIFELRIRASDDLADAVTSSNNYLCERNQAQMFVTGWFALFDPSTGIVEYVNAGHNRPYVLRKNGAVERIDGRGGRFLGMFPDAKYRTNRLRLNRGDRLLVYTDGITEAMDSRRKLYGEARLVSLLSTRPRDICKALKADIDVHAGDFEQSDDQTMLVLSYHGRPTRIAQTFPADDESLGSMTEFVRGVIGFEYPKQGVRLLNALDEVLANIVSYSGSPTVTIAIETVPGRCRVTVSDSGEAYNPLSHVDPDTHLSIRDRPIGGLGILMVKRLVSSVGYSREGGKNVLTLVQLDFSGEYRQIV